MRDSLHLGHHGWLRLLVAAALVLVLVLTLEASPVAGTSAKACRVRSTSRGQTVSNLQAAVKTAKPGDRLILTGTCHGKTTITKDLAIRGKWTGRSGAGPPSRTRPSGAASSGSSAA